MSTMEFKYTFQTHRQNSMLLGQEYASFEYSSGLRSPASRVKKKVEDVIPEKKPEGTLISATLRTIFVQFLCADTLTEETFVIAFTDRYSSSGIRNISGDDY